MPDYLDAITAAYADALQRQRVVEADLQDARETADRIDAQAQELATVIGALRSVLLLTPEGKAALIRATPKEEPIPALGLEAEDSDGRRPELPF